MRRKDAIPAVAPAWTFFESIAAVALVCATSNRTRVFLARSYFFRFPLRAVIVATLLYGIALVAHW